MSSGFAKVSRDELFGGCVGAVDGFLRVPRFQKYPIKHRITVAITKTLD